ncbi:MAG TPA: hypothetical protein VMX17_10400 [Candidatus Glassbacteria bacterium]|nr:hypothetical protein [Candidatus Glassbacteria bacterium]
MMAEYGGLIFLAIYFGVGILNFIFGVITMRLFLKENHKHWWSEGICMMGARGFKDDELVVAIFANTIKGSFLWPFSLFFFSIAALLFIISYPFIYGSEWLNNNKNKQKLINFLLNKKPVMIQIQNESNSYRELPQIVERTKET